MHYPEMSKAEQEAFFTAGSDGSSECKFYRPHWDGTQVTDLQEFWILVAHPVSIVFFALVTLAILRRNLWTGLLAGCYGLILAGHAILDTAGGNDHYYLAVRYGCIGYPDIFVLVVLGLSALVLSLSIWPHLKRMLSTKQNTR